MTWSMAYALWVSVTWYLTEKYMILEQLYVNIF